jgi:HlyD family secretion protein
MRVTIDEEGKTRVKDRFVISAPVSGFMRRVSLKVGDHVKKGQVVAELEPLRSGVLDPRSRAEAEASVSAAKASLNAAEENAHAAKADAEYARQKFERTKKLFEDSYVSKNLLEQAESEAKKAEANCLSADAAVKAAASELDRTKATLGYYSAKGVKDRGRVVYITAPVEGRVLKIHRESEGAVNQGEAIIDIGDNSKLEVSVEVLSADAVNIKQDTPVLFERWGGDIPLIGKVRVIEPSAFTKVSSLGVEEQRVLVIADITSLPESWQRLGDGYRVEARFIIWEGKDILQVPASSLFRKGEGWAVFIAKNRKAHLQHVEVGRKNGLVAEIISGLNEGDMVIAHPDDLIKDGTRIRKR